MMTAYRSTRTGSLHRRKSCTGGPGPRGLRRTRITEKEFDEAKRCRCLWVYRDDIERDERA